MPQGGDGARGRNCRQWRAAQMPRAQRDEDALPVYRDRSVDPSSPRSAGSRRARCSRTTGGRAGAEISMAALRPDRDPRPTRWSHQGASVVAEAPSRIRGRDEEIREQVSPGSMPRRRTRPGVPTLGDAAAPARSPHGPARSHRPVPCRCPCLQSSRRWPARTRTITEG